MDKTLEEKSSIPTNQAKPKKSGVLEQAWEQLDSVRGIEYQQESWWSILVFWIQELQWRRVFWEKMGHPPEADTKQ